MTDPVSFGARFDVALSFAGEDRQIAAAIAAELSKRGVSVFYDQYFQHELWGKDLAEHLGRVFSEQSRYCLVLASKSFLAKTWPRHELEHALSRDISQRDGILVVRLDDTPLPGLSPTRAFVNFTHASTLADLFVKRLELDSSSSRKVALRKRINEDALQILRYEGIVYSIDWSPDSEPDRDERATLAWYEKRYASEIDEFARSFGEHYDPLSALKG